MKIWKLILSAGETASTSPPGDCSLVDASSLIEAVSGKSMRGSSQWKGSSAVVVDNLTTK